MHIQPTQLAELFCFYNLLNFSVSFTFVPHVLKYLKFRVPGQFVCTCYIF